MLIDELTVGGTGNAVESTDKLFSLPDGLFLLHCVIQSALQRAVGLAVLAVDRGDRSHQSRRLSFSFFTSVSSFA